MIIAYLSIGWIAALWKSEEIDWPRFWTILFLWPLVLVLLIAKGVGEMLSEIF